MKYLFLIVFLMFAAFQNDCNAFYLQEWEMSDGKTFSAMLSDCDKEYATFKFSGGVSKKIKLDELSEKSRRSVILGVYKPRFQNALRALDSEVKSTTKTIEVDDRHLDKLNDIGIYIGELIKPVADKFKAGGEFDEDDDCWQKVHSGMAFFATNWMEELSSGDKMLKRGERRRPALKDIVKHIKNFNEFFTEIYGEKNYFKNRLGRQFPVKFTPKGYITDYQPYHYWAYLPKEYDGVKPMPVVFFLCGIGEFGTTLDSVLTNELPLLLEKRKDYPFIVISPQDNDRISRPPYFNEIYEDVKKRFKIDEDRVIVTGLSSGGTGAWRWALESPEKFAGIVPVCAVMPIYEIAQLKELPVWLFNNEYDNVWIQELGISNISKVNPNFKFTIFKGAHGHNAWSKTYTTKGLEQWMLSLRRKKDGDNKRNPLEEFVFDRSLSKALVKTVPGAKYMTLSRDASKDEGKYQGIIDLHKSRYGSEHDSYLSDLMPPLYNYQHFELNQQASAPTVRFIDSSKPKLYTYGIPVKNISDVKVKQPFELMDAPSYKCYSAMYLSEQSDPEASFARLRRLAKEAGHTLTGKDRIVYHQMLFCDRNIYELQVGVK